MKLIIERDAQNDVRKIARFYDKQEAGVGLYFITHFREDAAELRASGGIHCKRWGFHACQVKKFPIMIYYRIQSETVHICAVIDCRRDPDRIKRMLRSR